MQTNNHQSKIAPIMFQVIAEAESRVNVWTEAQTVPMKFIDPNGNNATVATASVTISVDKTPEISGTGSKWMPHDNAGFQVDHPLARYMRMKMRTCV